MRMERVCATCGSTTRETAAVWVWGYGCAGGGFMERGRSGVCNLSHTQARLHSLFVL